ncbi:hypothetical protein [Candidatus Nitrosocosmicus sp. SS]|uniref:hypothetical protein n=1 Tax=Candidatus Nitrosocosmicus agrestis TaxID=2563600 RepID=UPI00122E20C8|nr:hypothetical protein [Candidatus Nitrosocosmicus sp. SS]KAA2279065.1 hypothetical protein F1Z66_14400 [Candidatus Nitrosocosmicus sp. SS]KAF0867646.1 hypothetical protein E5N71_14215 [Candidatus Nitrosocosmicus sp. SS]
MNPTSTNAKDTIQVLNERSNSKNISIDSNHLHLKNSKFVRILKITRCPTNECKECKGQFQDKLMLGIFIECNCKCHFQKERDN